MSWDGHRLRFDTTEELRDYMLARLSGNSATQPPAPEERGVSPEDVLIEYCRHGNLTEEQMDAFWAVWNGITQQAWKERQLDSFRNAMSLAEALSAPNNVDRLTAFFSRNAGDYEWSDLKDHEPQRRILRLFLEWRLIPEDDLFWHDAFAGYLHYLESTIHDSTPEMSPPPLVAAYNGMSILKEEDIERLYAVLRKKTPDITKNQINSIFQDQQERCFGDEACVTAFQDARNEALDNILIATTQPDVITVLMHMVETSCIAQPMGEKAHQLLKPGDYPRKTGTLAAAHQTSA
ncbi:MAG: hypothetical protein ABW168_05830, partial [Sedimenticola sp.]